MAKDYFCVKEIILIHYLAAQEDCLTNRDSMMAVDWLNQSFERSVINFVLSDVMMPSKF